MGFGNPDGRARTSSVAAGAVIVRHLIGMRLASSTQEIVDRLGMVPGGDLALRQELANEGTAATVWCLIVTIGARRPHISVHASEELAELARDEALAAATGSAAVQWWITARVPGSGTAGPLTGDTVEPPPPARRATPAGRATPAQRKWARGPRP